MCLALACSGLGLPCLPCPAVVQGKAGKAGKTGPGQTKPRQGTTSKPAKPRQAFWLAGWPRFLAQTSSAFSVWETWLGSQIIKKHMFFDTFLFQPLKNIRKIKVLCLWGPCPRAKGVLAGPGTPRHPNSDIFVTKWVAIQPFWTSLAGFDAEFRPGAPQIGPTPSISTIFRPFLDPKMHKKSKI